MHTILKLIAFISFSTVSYCMDAMDTSGFFADNSIQQANTHGSVEHIATQNLLRILFLKRVLKPEDKSDEEVIRLLLKLGANPNASLDESFYMIKKWKILLTFKSVSPLLISALRGDLVVARMLLKAGAQVDCGIDTHTPWLESCLHAALHNCNTEYKKQRNLRKLIKLLVTHGANVNALDRNGQPPLAFACRIGKGKVREAIVLYLIRHGAQPSLLAVEERDKLLITIQDVFEQAALPGIAVSLPRIGIEQNLKNPNSKAFLYACVLGNAFVVHSFLYYLERLVSKAELSKQVTAFIKKLNKILSRQKGYLLPNKLAEYQEVITMLAAHRDEPATPEALFIVDTNEDPRRNSVVSLGAHPAYSNCQDYFWQDGALHDSLLTSLQSTRHTLSSSASFLENLSELGFDFPSSPQ